MHNLPIIKGTSIYLGPMPTTHDFYEMYREWLTSERVRFGINDCTPYSVNDVKEMLETWNADPNNMTFCIYENEFDVPIGDICLRYGFEEYENNGPETAIMIGRNFGKKKGFEAMTLLLNYAFNSLHHKQINLSVYRDNIPAVRLYEKLGFALITKQNEPGSLRPELIMTLTKQNWINSGLAQNIQHCS